MKLRKASCYKPYSFQGIAWVRRRFTLFINKRLSETNHDPQGLMLMGRARLVTDLSLTVWDGSIAPSDCAIGISHAPKRREVASVARVSRIEIRVNEELISISVGFACGGRVYEKHLPWPKSLIKGGG